MKSFHSFLLLLVALAVFSCKNDLADVGSSIQPDDDKIIIKADTFHLSTDNVFVERMYNRPDSLLIGTFVDEKYGTTSADILAQFAAPFDSTGFRYPENAQADSAFLILYYQSWFGDPSSSMEISAYEMTGDSIFRFYDYYPSNLDLNGYVDDMSDNTLLGKETFAANDKNLIRMRLKDEFRDKLMQHTKAFTNLDDFLTKFHGLYLTSKFGDATMMYLRSMHIELYYSYSPVEMDTTFVNAVTYAANRDVTQVNRFQHPDTARVKAYLAANDSINFVSSPAGIYTQVDIPLRRIVERMQDSIGYDKKLVVNSANVRVEAKGLNSAASSDLLSPVPANMLLMKKEEVDRFFTDKSLPGDSIVYSTFNTTDSCYTFNIARYITTEMNKAQKDEAGRIVIPDDMEEMEMVMVPVRITLSSGSSGSAVISAVNQQVLMTGVTVRSGKNPARPMKINVLYTGY